MLRYDNKFVSEWRKWNCRINVPKRGSAFCYLEVELNYEQRVWFSFPRFYRKVIIQSLLDQQYMELLSNNGIALGQKQCGCTTTLMATSSESHLLTQIGWIHLCNFRKIRIFRTTFARSLCGSLCPWYGQHWISQSWTYTPDSNGFESIFLSDQTV